MAVTWADSADKHGIAHEDALHAIGNACYVETEFDKPRVPGRVRPTLFIGPPRQLGGALLEVMVEVAPAPGAAHLPRDDRPPETPGPDGRHRMSTKKAAAPERTEKDYAQAAEWAEHDMTLKPGSTTALRGPAAAAAGRELLERATGGRPPLDPNAAPGQHSPVRQVRLPADLNDQLTAVAAAEHRRPSDVIRTALADYLADHTPSAR